MRPSSRLAAAAALMIAGSAAFAAGKVQSVPRTTPNAAQVSAFGLPKASGLTSAFPAGLNAGSGAAVSTDRIAAGNAPMPVDTAVNGNTVGNTTTTTTTGVNNGFSNQTTTTTGSSNGVTNQTTTTAASATTVLGAGPGIGTAGPSQNGNSGAGGYSAADIARWFYFADTDHDGFLTRAEYERLPVKPLSFEQMDRNFDGRISRFEYEDAFR